MNFFSFSDKSHSVIQCGLIIFFIPLYFVLEANNQYWLLLPAEVSMKIYIAVFLGMLFCLIGLQFFVQIQKAALISSWLAFHYLYFFKIFVLISSATPLSILRQYKYYLPVMCLIVGLFIFGILRLRPAGVKKLLSYILILSVILVIVELGKSLTNKSTIKDQRVTFVNQVNIKKHESNVRPDVFLIVMDEYAGSKSLKEIYNYDNSDFTKKLETLGFFVAKNSNSNYNGTLFSTLSLMNMSYLEMSSIGDLKSAKSYAKAARAIEDNLLFSFFADNNYKVVNNSFLRINKTESDPFLILPIEDRLILDKTFGSVVKDDLLLNIPSNKIQFSIGTFYARTEVYNLTRIKRLKEIVSDSAIKPVFIYTHLMMPHSPYLRDENGKLRDMSVAHKELKQKKYGNAYVNYLRYCNKVVVDLVGSIVTKRKNAIIVLVSDHGNRYYSNKTKSDHDYSNFVSVFSYNRNYDGFTDNVTLVNVFRLILNGHFCQKLDLLKNEQINVVEGVIN